MPHSQGHVLAGLRWAWFPVDATPTAPLPRPIFAPPSCPSGFVAWELEKTVICLGKMNKTWMMVLIYGKKHILEKKTLTLFWIYINLEEFLVQTQNLARRIVFGAYHIGCKFGLSPFPVIVTTRILTCLVGDPYKPSFATATERGPTQSIVVYGIFTIDLKVRNARFWKTITSHKRTVILPYRITEKSHLRQTLEDLWHHHITSIPLRWLV